MNGGASERERGADSALFALSSLQVAAHELKAPLTLIRQLSQAIESGEYTQTQIEEIARKLVLTSERGLRLTSDLTRSTRLDPTLFELEPLDPLPLCRDVISELAPLYHARGRELRLARRQRSVPLVVAHRDLLRRIIVNFADNALNYAEIQRPVELSLTYRRRQDMIRLGVRDFGPGLGRDVRRHVRAGALSAQVAYRPASSGLGIYIAQQFATAINADVGTIAHHDGATFYVDVPRSIQLGLW